MPWFSSDLKILNTPYPEVMPEGVTPDLSLDLVDEFVTRPIYKTSITQFPSTMEQRVSLQTTTRLAFSMTAQFLDADDVTNLIAFFSDHAGRMAPFKWYHKGELRYVRFDLESLDIKQLYVGINEVPLELIEVHPSEIIIDE